MDLLQTSLSNVSRQQSDDISYPNYSHEEYHFDTHVPYPEEYHYDIYEPHYKEYHDTHDLDHEEYDHIPYEYEHHREGPHDHFFYEPTFDFDHYSRMPVSTNTGLGGA